MARSPHPEASDKAGATELEFHHQRTDFINRVYMMKPSQNPDTMGLQSFLGGGHMEVLGRVTPALPCPPQRGCGSSTPPHTLLCVWLFLT